MDDFSTIEELQRYVGMKNQGNQVNGVSLAGVAVVGIGNFTGLHAVGTPVEVFIVNPNQMIYNPTAPTPVVGGGTLVVSSGGGTRLLIQVLRFVEDKIPDMEVNFLVKVYL